MMIVAMAIIALSVALSWYFDKKQMKLAAVLAKASIFAAVVGLIAYTVFIPPTVIIADTIKIGGMYNTAIPIESVTDVTLVNDIPKITNRTNGIDAFGFALIGNFKLEEWGKGMLFIQNTDGPYIVITYDDTFAIISYRDSGKTESLFNELKAQLTT